MKLPRIHGGSENGGDAFLLGATGRLRAAAQAGLNVALVAGEQGLGVEADGGSVAAQLTV
jgi:hypothetical protein